MKLYTLFYILAYVSALKTWNYQIGSSSVDFSVVVDYYDIDMFDTPASDVAKIRALNKTAIAYIDSQYENWRPDAKQFPADLLGNSLSGWAGERYVQINSPIIRNIMVNRIILAKSKGFTAIEFDNVDGYSNSNGLGTTYADQIDYNRFLAESAHTHNMTVALKNDLGQVNDLVSYFDFAINEECNKYDECDSLKPFVTNKKFVLGVEYLSKKSYNSSVGAELKKICPTMIKDGFSFIVKTLDLTSLPFSKC